MPALKLQYDPSMDDRGLHERLVGLLRSNDVSDELFGLVMAVDRRFRSVSGSPEIDARQLALLAGIFDWVNRPGEFNTPPAASPGAMALGDKVKFRRNMTPMTGTLAAIRGDRVDVRMADGSLVDVALSRVEVCDG